MWYPCLSLVAVPHTQEVQQPSAIFRCTRCKTTLYCSVKCQSKDWNDHRHVCKPSTLATPASESETEKIKENPPALPQVGSSPIPPAAPTKVQPGDDSRPQRVFLRDLRKHSFIKGDELQVCVVELQSPGRFFVHSQSPEMTELLRAITAVLEQTYGGPPGTNYSPHVGEVCVVRYSQDQKWYRGVVQSLSADQTIANVLYIDFGNEEAVTLEQIRPLAAHMDPVRPCALECRVAGVTPLTGSWTEKCCIALRMLLVGKSLTLTVAEASEEDHTYAVDVALSALGQQLSTFLLDQDYAAKEVTRKPTVEDIDSLVRASLENFRRSGGKEGEGEEDAGARAPDPLTQGLGDSFAAVVTHLQAPDDIICQKLDNAKGVGALRVLAASKPLTWSFVELPCHGQEVALVASVIKDPGEFYCCIYNPEVDAADVLLPPEPKTRAQFLRYSCQITLDPNTAYIRLSLSEGNRKVTFRRQNQSYPGHPERFIYRYQVLCREGLSGRSYWEVERSGSQGAAAVSYKDISRSGSDTRFGSNNKSWRLFYHRRGYSFYHNSVETKVSGPQSSRVGVYLDHRAGSLSFYSVSSDTMTLLHRVQTTFTEPLYPGIGPNWCNYGDSVKLCQLE